MKYVKPGSLTWWSSFVPLFAGIFIATAQLHGLAQYAEIVSAIFGDVSPGVLVNAGLIGIGLRGALP